VKTPLAFLLLVAIGAWICWTRRRQTAYWIPWALSSGILAPAMIGRVNIGVRHILPVYMGFSIVAAIALAELALQRRTRRWMAGMAAALLLWLIVSGAAQHPNYLAYFNELAGGHPGTILADSDLDWGQDTVRLAEWARAQGLQSVSFTAMNIPASWLSVWPGIPNDLPVDPRQPRGGWTAISPSLLLFNQYGLNHRNPNVKPWFEYLRPAGKIGAFLLYYIPPASVSRNSS
jgi:uncharacterized membrane protein